MSKNVRLSFLWVLYMFVICSVIHPTASCGGDPNAISGCGNCGRHCSDYDNEPVACALSCSLNGCTCKDGYYYDDNIKKCVLLKNCSPVCGQNEMYTTCVEGGCVGARNCSQITCGQAVPVICTKRNPQTCTVGCVCQDGFLRNDNGVCVPKEECLLNDHCSGKLNELYDPCPPMCFSDSCASIGKPIDCLSLPAVCRPRCRCAQGFYRNYKGVCVPKKQCNQCGKNEVYDKCVTTCPPRKCGINDAAVLCAPTNPADCKAGCRCADGFSRNDKGECVAPEDCPISCGGDFNAQPGCGGYCGNRCSNYNKSSVACILVCQINGCDCKKGYVYDDNIKKCVLPEKCTPTCGPDEYLDTCANGGCYSARTCKDLETLNGTSICVDTVKCIPGCLCNKGLLRNKEGKCVPKNKCPEKKCSGPYEYYSCGVACDNVCSTLSQQNQTNCPIINIKCNEMCYCQKGYARNRQNICVPISSCRRCPGKYEWYDTCPSTCPSSDGCDTYMKVYGCPAIVNNDTSHCKPACRCEDNYLRNSNGTCIPQEQCPCNGDENAKPGCGCSRTCSDFILNKPPTCTKICKINACDCKDGYVLEEKSGKCIHPKDCPVSSASCPKGQTLGCGNNCNRKCFNFRNGTSPIACPRIACTGIGLSCQCDPSQGYYYDDNKKKCVPSCECPP